jgi:hypothetical protein
MAEESRAHPHAYAQAYRSNLCVCAYPAAHPIHTDANTAQPDPVYPEPRQTGLRGIEAGREAVRQARGDEAYPQTPILFAAAPAGPAPATDRAGLAVVRALHQQYTFGTDPQDYCAHCNQISGGWIPWPCPTVRALDGEQAGGAQQDPTQDGEAPAAYSDGMGRVFCVACARPDSANVPLTVEHVDHWDLCPSCGRHVVDVARAAEQTTAVARPGQPETEARCPEAVWRPTPHPPHTWNQSPTHPQRPCPGVPAPE